MADLIVIIILVGLGYWSVRQLRDKGTSCCSKGGGCSGCSKASCASCQVKK